MTILDDKQEANLSKSLGDNYRFPKLKRQGFCPAFGLPCEPIKLLSAFTLQGLPKPSRLAIADRSLLNNVHRSHGPVVIGFVQPVPHCDNSPFKVQPAIEPF
jgi:hypothetical protein